MTITLTEQHVILARTWAQHNGQRGTDKQIQSIAKQLRVSDLCRMLAARGYQIPEGWNA
jgi:hypothetical protein